MRLDEVECARSGQRLVTEGDGFFRRVEVGQRNSHVQTGHSALAG